MDCKRPRNHWCQCLFRRNGKRRRNFEYNRYYVNQWSYYPTLPIQSPSHSPRIVRLPTLDNLGMTYDTLSVSAKIIFWQLILATLDPILTVSIKTVHWSILWLLRWCLFRLLLAGFGYIGSNSEDFCKTHLCGYYRTHWLL